MHDDFPKRICQVYKATGGGCHSAIGPLEEDQGSIPVEFHWPEDQPTLDVRLDEMGRKTERKVDEMGRKTERKVEEMGKKMEWEMKMTKDTIQQEMKETKDMVKTLIDMIQNKL